MASMSSSSPSPARSPDDTSRARASEPLDNSDSVAGVLASAARRWPDRVAFTPGAVRWPCGDAAARAARLAESLARHGARPGDVVAWIGDNTPAAALAYFGAAWAGAVLAPLHLRLTDADLRRVLAHAQARVVLAQDAHRERADALGLPVLSLDEMPAPSPGENPTSDPRPPARRAASDAAHLYYTSGSTGTPKGVVLTHGNVVTHARLAAAALDLCDRDVWLHAAP